ncbi:MAG: VOC family protein [Acidimicrobiales bacterium]|nr:VOC family protein [Acidimicrobiales bacterium]
MAVLGVSHVAVGVADMDRALTFYRDLVGLRVDLDIEESGFGKARDQRRRAVYLRSPDEPGPRPSFIVLDQQLTREPFGQPPRLFQLGTHHFSFWVDDLEQRVQRIMEAGFGVIVPPTVSDAVAYGEERGSGKYLTAIVRDADGNPVQFDQKL